MTDASVDHPKHYGGKDNPYEAIKVIEAWGLGFNLGNLLKYIARAELKGAPLQDLEKAKWYLEREIYLRKQNDGNQQQPVEDSKSDEKAIDDHLWREYWRVIGRGGYFLEFLGAAKTEDELKKRNDWAYRMRHKFSDMMWKA